MATATLTQENFEQTVPAGGIVLLISATWCACAASSALCFRGGLESILTVVNSARSTRMISSSRWPGDHVDPDVDGFPRWHAVFRQSGALPRPP